MHMHNNTLHLLPAKKDSVSRLYTQATYTKWKSRYTYTVQGCVGFVIEGCGGTISWSTSDLYQSHQHVLHPMNLLALYSILSKYVHCTWMTLTNLMFQCIFLVTEAIHSDNIWRKCPHTSERLPEIWIWVYAKIVLHQVRSDKQAFHIAFMHVYIVYYQVTVVTTSV